MIVLWKESVSRPDLSRVVGDTVLFDRWFEPSHLCIEIDDRVGGVDFHKVRARIRACLSFNLKTCRECAKRNQSVGLVGLFEFHLH